MSQYPIITVNLCLTVNLAAPGRGGAAKAGLGPGAGEVEQADVVEVLEGEVEAVGLIVALVLALVKVVLGTGVDEDTLEVSGGELFECVQLGFRQDLLFWVSF